MISDTGLARQVRPCVQRSFGVHVSHPTRKNKTKLSLPGTVRASQSVGQNAIERVLFLATTVQYGIMDKVIIKRSTLDQSKTYAQLAVLSVNMKPEYCLELSRLPALFGFFLGG